MNKKFFVWGFFPIKSELIKAKGRTCFKAIAVAQANGFFIAGTTLDDWAMEIECSKEDLKAEQKLDPNIIGWAREGRLP